ncbi:uncharacterized protein BCR38DRAFT_483484 [Pseudomassariella vexata]|uniref:Uncharacterized protein n=1 Tax=Pseudomassariella vexata TaxID=1141098 RepID=A0A1Y2E364_9PEZI|nr:uncharacterized protein BCR38DRAFT_483484 [Pseudomassariella vexata]ORY65804.1 hypothetical protein BCR38DRAFT_483484 [Pseudomassariella vexata]
MDLKPVTSSTGPARGANEEAKQSAFYQTYQSIMAPINFITFLLSLYLVDTRNQKYWSNAAFRSWLPAWLHPFIYKPQPYRWADKGPAPPNRNDERWYYHTRKRKLFKMEAADAFAMRNTVLVGLTLGAVVVSVAIWWLGSYTWSYFR